MKRKIIKRKIKKIGLCEGRHPMPVKAYIYTHSIADPTDTAGLEEEARVSLADIDEKIHLFIYVSGLTVALISALNVCREKNIFVTLMHYDTKSNNYYAQRVQ